jgi:HK97 family phage major capsid protein
MVPFTLDPTIILTNAGAMNPYRQVATIKTTTTNTWNGVTSAGVNAEWTAEGTEAADASPTVAQLTITPAKGDAYVFASDEFIGDSDFAQQLPNLLSDAKNRIEETAFAVGTGSVAGGFSVTDLTNLMAALPARFRGPGSRQVWLANLGTINNLRTKPLFTNATVPLVSDVTGEPTAYGKPVLESTSILGYGTNGNKALVFMDATQYYIVDRIGVSMIFDPAVVGTNRKLTGQSAWYMFWRVGADLSTSTAARVLTATT